MAQTVQIDVQVASGVVSAPQVSDIQKWVEQAISRVGTDATRDLEVSVRVVGEEEARSLNKQFRDQDSTTNVLSFPSRDAGSAVLPVESMLALGDIVICGPVVVREAQEQGKDSSDHWAHMLVHGALHLLGYDHETDAQAAEMESLEVRILADGGVANPYGRRDGDFVQS